MHIVLNFHSWGHLHTTLTVCSGFFCVDSVLVLLAHWEGK